MSADRVLVDHGLPGRRVPAGGRFGTAPSGVARQTVAPVEVGAREPAARAGTAGPAMAAAVLRPLPIPAPGAGQTTMRALIAASTARAGANQTAEPRRVPGVADLVVRGRPVMAGLATIRSSLAGHSSADSRVQLAAGGAAQAVRLGRAPVTGSVATGLLAVASGPAAAGRATGPARASRGPQAAVRMTGRGRVTGGVRMTGRGRVTGGVQMTGAVSSPGNGQARLGSAVPMGSAALLATAECGAASQDLTNCAWLSRKALLLTSWIRKLLRSYARCRGTLPASLPGS